MSPDTVFCILSIPIAFFSAFAFSTWRVNRDDARLAEEGNQTVPADAQMLEDTESTTEMEPLALIYHDDDEDQHEIEDNDKQDNDKHEHDPTPQDQQSPPQSAERRTSPIDTPSQDVRGPSTDQREAETPAQRPSLTSAQRHLQALGQQRFQTIIQRRAQTPAQRRPETPAQRRSETPIERRSETPIERRSGPGEMTPTRPEPFMGFSERIGVIFARHRAEMNAIYERHQGRRYAIYERRSERLATSQDALHNDADDAAQDLPPLYSAECPVTHSIVLEGDANSASDEELPAYEEPAPPHCT